MLDKPCYIALKQGDISHKLSIIALIHFARWACPSHVVTLPERDGLPGAPVTSVTIPQGDQQGWWLRRFAHLDDCGDLGLPLPQARVRADYDDPPGDRSLSSRLSPKGPGRRYVSEVGYLIR